MLLIAISWCYILFCLLNSGVATLKALKISTENFYFTAFFGLIGTTVVASIWAFFGPLSGSFHLFLLLFNMLLLYYFWSTYTQLYCNLVSQIKNMLWPVRLLFVGFTVLLLAQSASAPFIVDNESYYIQTIKWLNQYGLVNGLANLHPFFAVASGWHITQAAFSFSFLYDRFNDLNGLCLWLIFGFALEKFNNDLKSGTNEWNFIGLVPVLGLFLFQFVSAPSPDLPIYCCTFLIVYTFFFNEKKTCRHTFIVTLALGLFACYLKPTAVVLLLFPLYILVTHFKVLKSSLPAMIAMGGFTLFLFVTKNTIVSGYPLFPFVGFQFVSVDYAMPLSIAQFYFEQTKLVAFNCTAAQFASLSVVDRFFRWISLPGLHGYLNTVAVALIVITPFAFRFFIKSKKVGVVYGIMTLQFLLLFFTSPQYRFFINFILVFILLFLIKYVKNKNLLIGLQFASMFLVIVYLSFKVSLQSLSTNPSFQTNRRFSIENSMHPYQNSTLSVPYRDIQKGNLHFYTPVSTTLFWEVGNAPLPGANENAMHYFEKYFGYIPQMRSEKITDGFYAKKIK